MGRNHPKSHPIPPTHSPIQGVESTPKTGAGIRKGPKSCLARTLRNDAPGVKKNAPNQNLQQQQKVCTACTALPSHPNHISSYGYTLFFQNMQTGLVSSLVCNHKLAKAGTDDPRLSEILGNTVTDKVCSSTSHSSKCSKLTPQAQHTASHIMRTARLSAPDHDSREPRGLQHVHFNSIP